MSTPDDSALVAASILGHGPQYDPEREKNEYARSLLSKDDDDSLREELNENGGFWTIKHVRALIIGNSVKTGIDMRGENCGIDAEMMLLIDTRINFCIYIAGDNVYTRGELIANYPFEEFRKAPEDVFVQQEVGVFPPRKWAADEKENEYIARDVGDTAEFIMLEDMVGRATRRDYKMKRSPILIAKTKIYLGREQWEDFQFMKRFVRSVQQFIPIEGGAAFGDAVKALPWLLGKGLLLRDESGAKEDQLQAERAAQEKSRREARQAEAEIRRRAEALQAREEKLRRREEEAAKIEAKFRERDMLPPEGVCSERTRARPPSRLAREADAFAAELEESIPAGAPQRKSFRQPASEGGQARPKGACAQPPTSSGEGAAADDSVAL